MDTFRVLRVRYIRYISYIKQKITVGKSIVRKQLFQAALFCAPAKSIYDLLTKHLR